MLKNVENFTGPENVVHYPCSKGTKGKPTQSNVSFHLRVGFVACGWHYLGL